MKSKYSLTCEMLFDAAHRLSNYEGKCKRIHGHTYRVIIEISADSLNDWGIRVSSIKSGFWEDKELTRVAVVKKDNGSLIGGHSEA